MRTWASAIESKINEADNKVRELRQCLGNIEENERAAAEIERRKQLEFEKQKFELEQEAKEERKRELKHKAEILSQQLEYQKSIEKTEKKYDQNAAIKLPKLLVTKFDGNFANWLPFWNTFQAEVDKSDEPHVTNFAYLKEWLEPKVRSEIEGYLLLRRGIKERKIYLKVNMGKQAYNTQVLETLQKLDKVSGFTRNVLEKFKGIKADLVRGNEGWQDWDLTRLISELKKWREINPVEANAASKKSRRVLLAKDGERRKQVCVYCDSENHSSKDCSIITDTDKLKKLLAEKKLCFNCTGNKHHAVDCKSTHKCSKCNMKHHSSICTKKEQLLTAN